MNYEPQMVLHPVAVAPADYDDLTFMCTVQMTNVTACCIQFIAIYIILLPILCDTIYLRVFVQ